MDTATHKIGGAHTFFFIIKCRICVTMHNLPIVAMSHGYLLRQKFQNLNHSDNTKLYLPLFQVHLLPYCNIRDGR